MKMRTQQFGLCKKPSQLVTIETPVGFISISGKNIEVEIPACLRAHKGRERAIEHARWLSVDGEIVSPKYSILSPVTDSEGSIIGLESPNEFFVACGAGDMEDERDEQE